MAKSPSRVKRRIIGDFIEFLLIQHALPGRPTSSKWASLRAPTSIAPISPTRRRMRRSHGAIPHLLATHWLWQSEGSQRCRSKTTGHLQPVIALITRDGHARLRAVNTVEYTAIVTLSGQVRLDGPHPSTPNMDRWTHRIRNNPGRHTGSSNRKDKTRDPVQTRNRRQKQRTDCGRSDHGADPSRGANLHRDVRRYGPFFQA